MCLLLDAFGAGMLFMLSESLVALHVDKHERSRVMAIQRTCVMLATAPFGWISGWLSAMDRRLPFVLTAVLLGIGAVVAARFWVTTHSDQEGEPMPIAPTFRSDRMAPACRRCGVTLRPLTEVREREEDRPVPFMRSLWPVTWVLYAVGFLADLAAWAAVSAIPLLVLDGWMGGWRRCCCSSWWSRRP